MGKKTTYYFTTNVQYELSFSVFKEEIISMIY